MTKVLSDGTVVPSFLSTQSASQRQSQATNQNRSNTALRLGYVTKAYFPSEGPPEYDVVCMQVDGYGAESEAIYSRCQVATVLGSVADKSYRTLRSAGTNKAYIDKDVVADGTRVLLLCVNGRSEQAVIVGCLPNRYAKFEEEGHHCLFEFNGVKILINQDGEFLLRLGGATDEKGETENEDGGSQVFFSKDGSVEVKTGDSHSIKLDKATGHCEIKTNGVKTGSATDATIKGTTYRAAEGAMNTTVSSSLAAAATALGAAGTALGGAGSAMTPKGPLPVESAVLGPVLAGAAASIAAAVAALTAAATAITTFEGTSSTYLSDKNRSD